MAFPRALRGRSIIGVGSSGREKCSLGLRYISLPIALGGRLGMQILPDGPQPGESFLVTGSRGRSSSGSGQQRYRPLRTREFDPRATPRCLLCEQRGLRQPPRVRTRRPGATAGPRDFDRNRGECVRVAARPTSEKWPRHGCLQGRPAAQVRTPTRRRSWTYRTEGACHLARSAKRRAAEGHASRGHREESTFHNPSGLTVAPAQLTATAEARGRSRIPQKALWLNRRNNRILPRLEQGSYSLTAHVKSS